MEIRNVVKVIRQQRVRAPTQFHRLAFSIPLFSVDVHWSMSALVSAANISLKAPSLKRALTISAYRTTSLPPSCVERFSCTSMACWKDTTD